MSRIRKIILLVMLLLCLGVWALASWASSLTPGEPAPNFLVKSGDDQMLTRDKIQGKVIVFFYESRNSLGQNKALKDVLKEFYRTQPTDIRKDVFRLVVVDCSESSWPTLSIWKKKLREHSTKEGFTIYGDWDRKMFADYRMQAGESNFLILDKHGIIRYSAAGRVSEEQFGKIKEVLLNLIQAS